MTGSQREDSVTDGVNSGGSVKANGEGGTISGGVSGSEVNVPRSNTNFTTRITRAGTRINATGHQRDFVARTVGRGTARTTSGESSVTGTVQGITSGDWAQWSDSWSERVNSQSARIITSSTIANRRRGRIRAGAGFTWARGFRRGRTVGRRFGGTSEFR